MAALGRYDEAANEAERVWQGAAASAGPASHQALAGQIDYASTRCLTARRTEGLKVARDALETAQEAFGADYPLTHVIRYFASECLIANQSYAEAGRLLDGLDRQKIFEMTGQTDLGGKIDLALAEVALAQGDRQSALRKFQSATSALKEAEDTATRSRLEELGRRPGT